MKTTLNKIRKYKPCEDGWELLLKTLGKTKADDEPISIIAILNSNGLNDAIWCLRAVDGHDREIRLFAVYCARQVQHLMKDARSINALDISERFANGEATQGELDDAKGNAEDAVAARSAARAAAEDAEDAEDAVAARSAARAAARAARAAEDAADAVAARSAPWAAARAAWAAARAAWAAAEDAADAAEDAADAVAARAAARAAQETELRRICAEIELHGTTKQVLLYRVRKFLAEKDEGVR